jgi:hypothetical protein
VVVRVPALGRTHSTETQVLDHPPTSRVHTGRWGGGGGHSCRLCFEPARRCIVPQ